MIAAADPNLTSAAASFTGYLTDNGPTVIGVIVALGLFGLGVRWVGKLIRGRSPV